MALFPDAIPSATLHAFSGSLPAGQYLRCDSVCEADYQCRVEDLPATMRRSDMWQMRLVIADPPYSKEDAQRYGTPMVNRGRVLRSMAEITAQAGHLAWLDCVWPMHRKDQWLTVGRVQVVGSTNHRLRGLTIFERVAAA